jgi:hypothetical protein
MTTHKPSRFLAEPLSKPTRRDRIAAFYNRNHSNIDGFVSGLAMVGTLATVMAISGCLDGKQNGDTDPKPGVHAESHTAQTHSDPNCSFKATVSGRAVNVTITGDGFRRGESDSDGYRVDYGDRTTHTLNAADTDDAHMYSTPGTYALSVKMKMEYAPGVSHTTEDLIACQGLHSAAVTIK